MEHTFTIDEARRLLPALRARTDLIVSLRADLVDAEAALRRGEQPPGGIAEVKAKEAHLQEAIDWFGEQGIELKGVAPVLADLPSLLDGEPVLLCWLEGERELAWYHRPDAGFMGRRRLPD